MAEPILSVKALTLLRELFNEKSNLSLPAGVAREIVEILEWATRELAQHSSTD